MMFSSMELGTFCSRVLLSAKLTVAPILSPAFTVTVSVRSLHELERGTLTPHVITAFRLALVNTLTLRFSAEPLSENASTTARMLYMVPLGRGIAVLPVLLLQAL